MPSRRSRNAPDPSAPSPKQAKELNEKDPTLKEAHRQHREDQERFRNGTHPSQNPLWDDTRG